ncbi:major capsid protein [Mailhella massiliensis]|uniref:major capsid protein n=1 Tax=Mailhella massiliensis TaxID=1903261 RepID=UPI0023F28D39|nr:major capsid protein [Mailhella massiliensis]
MRKRNKFSLSHYKLCTMDMGELIPVSWFEALPGDTIQMQTSAFVRVAPTLAPIMTPCHVEFRSFSVPLRQIWDGGKDDCWESFITGGDDGMDVSEPPYFKIAKGFNVPVGSLADYLGIPAGEVFGSDVSISALPFRAYFRIWNEFFRDEDLQQVTLFDSDINGGYQGDGNSQTFLSSNPSKVNWRKDYITVARPWEQKGPAVTVPVQGAGGGITGNVDLAFDSSGPQFKVVSGSYGSGEVIIDSTTGSQPLKVKSLSGDPGIEGGVLGWGDNPGITATFSSTTPGGIGSISVNDIREAFALQRFEEARALFGSRYVEYLRYLGVKSSDARLQRPEYLGGGSQVIQWSEVVQTGQGTDPVGTLRGHGVSGGRTRRWRRFFEEHCLVMTLAWIRPIALYMQSLPRAWSRTIKEDYWQKELEHIGEQEVLNKEIYALGDNPDGVFGYMDRYDEYRSIQNTVSGDFRTTLNYWHLGREFSNQPVLNSSFVTCNPTKRIFAEQTADEFYCMFLHSVQARRLVSRKGRPGGL